MKVQSYVRDYDLVRNTWGDYLLGKNGEYETISSLKGVKLSLEVRAAITSKVLKSEQNQEQIQKNLETLENLVTSNELKFIAKKRVFSPELMFKSKLLGLVDMLLEHPYLSQGKDSQEEYIGKYNREVESCFNNLDQIKKEMSGV